MPPRQRSTSYPAMEGITPEQLGEYRGKPAPMNGDATASYDARDTNEYTDEPADNTKRVEFDVLGEWAARSACYGLDPEIFFPGQWDREARAKAKEICDACQIRPECFDYAMSQGASLEGFWAGTSKKDRQELRKMLEES